MRRRSNHIFTNPGFQLSTDYQLLWDIIRKGHRIPAWIVYTDEYEEPIWDIVEVRYRDDRYSIGVRGIGYEGIKDTFEGFRDTCTHRSLHFIIPS